VPEVVDAAAPGPAGELGVLPRREQLVALALELPEVFDHDRLRGHVDPEGQGLRGEHDLHEPRLEELLDGLLEHGQHARVVRGDAGLEALEELVEAERHQVGVVDPGGARLGAFPDPRGLVTGREPDPGLPHPPHALVAARAAEDEVDRGQHPLPLEDLDDLLAPRRVDAVRAPALGGAARRAAPPRAGPPPHLLLVEGDDVRVRQEDAVLFDVHRVEPPADEVVVLEGHRAFLLDHDGGLPAERADPLPELLRVRDRGGQAHDGDRPREMDQDLLPDGPSVGVLEVMDLVHHDPAQSLQRAAALVEHVPQDLGGHHDDRRLAVDRVIAGEEADLLRTVRRREVAELLVRERLQRRGVEALVAGREPALHGELRDDRLP
jgi:hypothetical protein